MEQQLQQHLAQLKGDILLAEKKLQSLQKDIENLQSSKGKALKEYDLQVKNKKEEIETLSIEGKRVDMLCRLFSQTLEQLKEEREEMDAQFAKKVDEATTKVQTIHSDAEKRERAVRSREENVQYREDKVDIREQNAERKLEKAERVQLDNEAKEFSIEKREKEVGLKEEKSRQAIAKAQELLDDINRKIQQKTTQMQNLDTTIEKKTAYADSIGIEAMNRLKRTDELFAELASKEAMLNEKDKELIKKSLWLSDRERTIARAYRETLKRGGSVN